MCREKESSDSFFAAYCSAVGARDMIPPCMITRTEHGISREREAEGSTGTLMRKFLETLPHYALHSSTEARMRREAQFDEQCRSMAADPWAEAFLQSLRIQTDVGLVRSTEQILNHAIHNIERIGPPASPRELARRARWLAKGLDWQYVNRDAENAYRLFPERPLSVLPLIETGQIADSRLFFTADTLRSLGWLGEEALAEMDRLNNYGDEEGSIGPEVNAGLHLAHEGLITFLRSDPRYGEAAQDCYHRLAHEGRYEQIVRLHAIFPDIPPPALPLTHLVRIIERNGLEAADEFLYEYEEGLTDWGTKILTPADRSLFASALFKEQDVTMLKDNLRVLTHIIERTNRTPSSDPRLTKDGHPLEYLTPVLARRIEELSKQSEADPIAARATRCRQEDMEWILTSLKQLGEAPGHSEADAVFQEIITRYARHILHRFFGYVAPLHEFATLDKEGLEDERDIRKMQMQWIAESMEAESRHRGEQPPPREELMARIQMGVRKALLDTASGFIFRRSYNRPKSLLAAVDALTELGAPVSLARAFACQELKHLITYSLESETTWLEWYIESMPSLALSEADLGSLMEAAVEAGKPLLAMAFIPEKDDAEQVALRFVTGLTASLQRRPPNPQQALTSLIFLRQAPGIEASLGELNDPEYVREYVFPQIEQALTVMDGAFLASLWLRYAVPYVAKESVNSSFKDGVSRLVSRLIDTCVETGDATTLEDLLLDRSAEAGGRSDPSLVSLLEIPLRGPGLLRHLALQHLEGMPEGGQSDRIRKVVAYALSRPPGSAVPPKIA